MLATQAHPEEGRPPTVGPGAADGPGSAHPGTWPQFPLLLGGGEEKGYLVVTLFLCFEVVLVHPRRLPPMRTVRHQTIFTKALLLPSSSFPLPAVDPLFFEGSGPRTVSLLPAGWRVGAMGLFC